MTIPDPLHHALQRLGSAIDHLEAAAARRAQADAQRRNAEDEFTVMEDDRARLAADLDGALAQGRVLARANDEVAERLRRTSTAVRAILAEIAVPAGPP